MTKKLIDLARAATPGQWVTTSDGCVGVRYPEGGQATIATCPLLDLKRNGENDAAFIAAANPQRIIELCEAAEAVLGVWEGEPLSPELQRLRKALEVDALEGRHDHC